MLFRRKKKLRSFTYFIPAPPSRKIGYREKELDTIINHILNNGFSIKKMQTTTISNEKMSGVWVFLLLLPLRADCNDSILDFEYSEIVNKENDSKELEISYEE